jgi:hypothetical protein
VTHAAQTAAPAGNRRRGRRLPVVRSGVAAAVLAALAAGCGGGGGSPGPAANVFTTRQQVSLQQVRTEITALYSAHPGIATFTTQDVQYSVASRDTVLRECTSGNGSQHAETGQVIACAPMIFFLYSYGKQASVPAAVTAAGQLYWYAVTHIAGPASAKTSLDEILRSWQLPVPGLTTAQARTAVASSVISAADESMLTQRAVRMEISPGTPAGGQRIVADIGSVTGAETISSGAATATIRITGKAAYFTGNTAGLTAYIGLSAKAAAKASSRWVMIKAGTPEYQDLAVEDTIASLPSSILPSASEITSVLDTTVSGQKAYVLSWTATSAGTPIKARLILTATPQVLPVSETVTTSAQSKTITFSRWGTPFTVAAPTPVIPYTQVSG